MLIEEDTKPNGLFFHELIYDPEMKAFFEKHWPKNEIHYVDASDSIHPGRFEVTVMHVDEDVVYPLIISEGWHGACLKLQMMLRMEDHRLKITRWIDKAEELARKKQDA